MNEPIELHDSEVLHIREDGKNIVIELRANTHRSPGEPGRDPGTGWVQAALLRFRNGGADREPTDLESFEIAGGTRRVGDAVFENGFTLPLGQTGRAELVLDGRSDRDGYAILRVEGDSVEVTLIGEARKMEDFR